MEREQEQQREPWNVFQIQLAIEALTGELDVLNRRLRKWGKEVVMDPIKLVAELDQRIALGGQLQRDAPLSGAVVLAVYAVMRELVRCALAVAQVRALLTRPGPAPSHAELAVVVRELVEVRSPFSGIVVPETISHTAARWCHRRGSYAAYAELFMAAHVIAAADDGPEWTITLPRDLDGMWEVMSHAAADLAEDIAESASARGRVGFVIFVRRSHGEPSLPPLVLVGGGP